MPCKASSGGTELQHKVHVLGAEAQALVYGVSRPISREKKLNLTREVFLAGRHQAPSAGCGQALGIGLLKQPVWAGELPGGSLASFWVAFALGASVQVEGAELGGDLLSVGLAAQKNWKT